MVCDTVVYPVSLGTEVQSLDERLVASCHEMGLIESEGDCGVPVGVGDVDGDDEGAGGPVGAEVGVPPVVVVAPAVPGPDGDPVGVEDGRDAASPGSGSSTSPGAPAPPESVSVPASTSSATSAAASPANVSGRTLRRGRRTVD